MVSLHLIAFVCLSAFRGLTVTASPVRSNANVTHPVIFVPGIEGSQLYAKLNRSFDHIFCYKSTKDFYSLWINPLQLLPEIVECFVQNMRLDYDNVTRTTSNSPGVDIVVPEGLQAIEWLSEYRYSIYEQQLYFENLKKLIEETFEINDGKKTAIVCHSMGCLFTLYFLNTQCQQWKDKYIHAMATIGAPWGGSVVALQATTIGYNLGVWILKNAELVDMERTFPSTGQLTLLYFLFNKNDLLRVAFLLPSGRVFEKNMSVIVTPDRNYTIADLQDFFKDIKDNISYEMWKDTSELLELRHPGVDVMCVHGYGLDTVEQMVYKSAKDFPRKPTMITGDGDATVNLASLRACRQWSNVTQKRFVYKTWPKIDHVDMVKDMSVINQVYQFVES